MHFKQTPRPPLSEQTPEMAPEMIARVLAERHESSVFSFFSCYTCCNAGYNVCIFAYGQTGSGKTHTMAGTNIEQYEGRGINYRALDDLFALNAKRQGEVSDP